MHRAVPREGKPEGRVPTRPFYPAARTSGPLGSGKARTSVSGSQLGTDAFFTLTTAEKGSALCCSFSAACVACERQESDKKAAVVVGTAKLCLPVVVLDGVPSPAGELRVGVPDAGARGAVDPAAQGHPGPLLRLPPGHPGTSLGAARGPGGECLPPPPPPPPLQPECPQDARSLMLLLHVLVTFTSTSSWNLLRGKDSRACEYYGGRGSPA